MSNLLHDKVFDFCESYRASHPDFYYWLRERNTKHRFEEGLWFQGTETYAFVGLYNANGGSNRTRSFGLVFWLEGAKVVCQLENVFNEEKDSKIISLYNQFRGKVVGFDEKSTTKYHKLLSADDGFAAATIFLDTVKPQLDVLVNNNNLRKLFIAKTDFEKKLKRIQGYRSLNEPMEAIKYIMVNITWNSNDWQGISQDKSGHKWVNEGNIPHESWNFDFENTRNTPELIRGFGQFTNPPKVTGNNNLIVFYSDNKIVGFYGETEVEKPTVTINEQQSYNLTGSRPLCILLKNKINDTFEKGYLEDNKRVGRIGFCYLEKQENIKAIIHEAILLNPDTSPQLYALADWLQIGELKFPNYWVFQANPTIYNITGALKAGILKTWMVNQYKKDIQIGDKIILWVTGENAGIYALATVTSPLYKIKEDDDEYEFYIDKSQMGETDRVRLRLDYNLVEKPILKKQVLSTDNLKDLKQGKPGTNFPATKLQYDTILNIIQMDTNQHNPLNQILFGPPGTGKTYHTVTEAVKIVDNVHYLLNADNRDQLQQRFNKLLITDWEKAEGQISFCTFHQSFSYEDFVEGIKPLAPEKGDQFLKYDIVDGIFKKICRLAEANNNALKLAKLNLVSLTQDELNKAIFYKLSLGDSSKEEDKEIYNYCINNNVISIGFGESTDFTGKDEGEINQIVIDEKLIPYTAQAINFFKNYLKLGNYVVVSYGNSYIRALGKVIGEYEYISNAEIPYKHFRKVEWIFKDVEIPATEFYKNNLTQKTIYKLNSEFIIPSFFVPQHKQTDVAAEQKNFVLVIDEINRGNVSSIFGELITLIETTKRTGKPEALEVVLPYSKDIFSVPENVYIIGTMNTADRSIEMLDTALRRRFSFKEMVPDPSLIATAGKSKDKQGVVGGIDLVKMLQKINERIEKLIDKDHKIGHSYFLDVINVEGLELAFKDKVIPLLEEYFFGDFGKIGLVLGSSFIIKEPTTDFDFADFADYDSQTKQDLKQRSVYKLKPTAGWDYKSIYEPKIKE
jgi:5-methylcytosine-specific restriction endonuclease McrBC GTP-binding regulatory subunit McrB